MYPWDIGLSAFGHPNSRSTVTHSDQTSSYLNTTSTAMTREEKRLAKDPLYADDLGKGKAKFAAMKKLKNGRLPGGMPSIFVIVLHE